MESVRLMTKCVWAMGLTSKVAVNETVTDPPPYRRDRFLYPERWTLDPVRESEDDFIKRCLKNPTNSYGLTKRTLVVICGVAVVQGLSSVAAIVLWKGLK
jgi:hypothetical protein